MGALLGFVFLVGGILAINWALRALWSPSIAERAADDPSPTD